MRMENGKFKSQFWPLIFPGLNPTDGFTRVCIHLPRQKLHFKSFNKLFLELKNIIWFKKYFVLEYLKTLETPCSL